MIQKPGKFLRAAIGASFLGLLVWTARGVGLRADANPQAKDVLSTLRPGHPRLYVLDSDLAGVKQAMAQDPTVKEWYDQLEAEAEKMLSEPPAEYKLIGPRLLGQSRVALRHISTLAGLYRLDGDRRKAERARQELLTIAAFKDWHPPHFLDVAEMTNAAAIGYDWLYDDLSPQDRSTIRHAIVENGIKAGLDAYAQRAWWTRTEFNWNQVCNGGLTAGALAVAEDEPGLARELIEKTRASIPIAMRSYAPDGGWAEGPGYWNYATEYNVFFLSAAETALGTDFGLKQSPGFAEAGLFRIQTTGPLGLTFNYADAEPHAGTAPEMFWLAGEFHRPVYAQDERARAMGRPKIFHLLWSGPVIGELAGNRGDYGTDLLLRQLPLDAFYSHVNVAVFRSAWQDPKAFYLGFKGGDNKANHSHLDLGTFVLDALGERWALDLGPDDYNLPGYFGKQRFNYYRLQTRGHNTLTLDGESQNTAAKAPVVAFYSSPERAFAVADLTQGYAPKAHRILRGVALLHRDSVMIEDEVVVTKRAEVLWNFHTRAKVELHGNRAELVLNSQRLEARILSPRGAKFEVVPADPPPPEAQQPDVHNLTVRWHGAGKLRLAVFIAAPGQGRPPKVEPLEAWVTKGKLSP
ncbi:MAG TPA: heparinase II/III family protein [Terriglobia bacterium]|nr:heparinase II/III family protein [Terriglobia bacterium]